MVCSVVDMKVIQIKARNKSADLEKKFYEFKELCLCAGLHRWIKGSSNKKNGSAVLGPSHQMM